MDPFDKRMDTLDRRVDTNYQELVRRIEANHQQLNQRIETNQDELLRRLDSIVDYSRVLARIDRIEERQQRVEISRQELHS